jgi:hypothetical protein
MWKVLTLPDSELPNNPISPLRQNAAYLLVILGCLVTPIGVGLIYLPAGIITLGLMIMWFGYLLGAE